MRATTLKASTGDELVRLVDYYAGLADDQQRRDGLARGPVDYYLDPDEPPGQWWGSGRSAVGLAGEVEPDQLRRMLIGRHPVSGERLGRGFGPTSARAFDATFSAPKSVSVLWALSPDPWVRAEVLAAHDIAVTAALGWLERHGAVARRGTNGVDQVDTRGLVVALFRQHTSRTADPQLHTHALVWSKVQDPTGRWLALDARFLKGQQRSIGWIYDAALRVELTSRTGVEWGPAVDGPADLTVVPEGLREVFSRRAAQVEARLAKVLRWWVDQHDGAEPDPRTIARLERDAVLHSRPVKRAVGDADTLRADWTERTRAAGYELPVLIGEHEQLPGFGPCDPDAIIGEAVARVSEQGSTWLRADLAREIATLVPPDAAYAADDLVDLVDRLAEQAAGRCVELHPPAPSGTARRSDRRPVTEAVTHRLLSTSGILGQERRLLDWAHAAAHHPRNRPAPVVAAHLDDEQRAAAAAIAGTASLVLVVGPAGTGPGSIRWSPWSATRIRCFAPRLITFCSPGAAGVAGAAAGRRGRGRQGLRRRPQRDLRTGLPGVRNGDARRGLAFLSSRVEWSGVYSGAVQCIAEDPWRR